MLPGIASSQVGHDIHRVGGDQQDGIGRVAHHLGHYVGKDGRMSLLQLQARLTGLLGDTGSQDNDAAAGQVGIVP